MGQAIFAKYQKGISLQHAHKIINELASKGARPISYLVYCESVCDRSDISLLFEKGSTTCLKTIATQGVYSVANSKGIWSCIQLSSNMESLLIYTAGSSDIMYYSFL